MTLAIRKKEKHPGSWYHNPYDEVAAGLWTLWASATIFLALRTWVKITRRRGLWYDDYILITTWVILTANDSIIQYMFGHGYVTQKWDDRMHIIINITSCGTLIGVAWSKTAFAVTLLRMVTKNWQKWFLWYCIITMNSYATLKTLFQWAKICNKPSYQNWYRIDFCVGWDFRERFNEGGNVYNVLMDFAMALIPWAITWNLRMKRYEKIGLSITMSLGMIVAIVAAMRTWWRSDEIDSDRDPDYHWKRGMSMIWYSSEITGTIMVQCIPVLRPFFREIHQAFTSERLSSNDDTRKTNTLKRLSRRIFLGGHAQQPQYDQERNNNVPAGKAGEQVELDNVNSLFDGKNSVDGNAVGNTTIVHSLGNSPGPTLSEEYAWPFPEKPSGRSSIQDHV